MDIVAFCRKSGIIIVKDQNPYPVAHISNTQMKQT